MTRPLKELIDLRGRVAKPPLSQMGLQRVAALLESLCEGDMLSMPQSRPMPAIGKRCHELRFRDANRQWRAIYRIDEDAIVVVDVFQKKTQETPKQVIGNCRRRLRTYDGK